VEAEAMFAGDEREGIFEITAQFVWRSGFAGIIAGDSEAAAEGGVRLFEASDVVPLPAMKRDWDARKLGESFADIDAKIGITFFGESEGAFEVLG